MKHIINHFKRVDPILASVLVKITMPKVKASDDYFSDLCEIIIQQQLSEKAGETIWNRFLKLFPTLTPNHLLKTPDKKIREAGISWGKVSYIKNLATHVSQKTLHLDTLAQMSDTEVIAELTKVKGIGPWTAEMFLMFSLGREDVFSYGDLGLRNAIKKLYKFKKEPTRSQMEKIVNKWTPYRTYAARILWESLVL